MSEFTICQGITNAERPDVARLYRQAFSAKLGELAGPDARTRGFYDLQGFTAAKTQNIGPLRLLFGF